MKPNTNLPNRFSTPPSLVDVKPSDKEDKWKRTKKFKFSAYLKSQSIEPEQPKSFNVIK